MAAALPPNPNFSVESQKSMDAIIELEGILSKAPGKAAIAIIRVSGGDSKHVLTQMLKDHKVPEPRMAVLRHIQDPLTHNVIDEGMAIWFPGPKSFTGEDSFELHVHGSKAVISYIIQAIMSFDNVRLAEPGEFMRRAYFNNKMVLSQVEGFADLLNAETEIQRKQAMQHSQGALKNIYKCWRQIIFQAIVAFEADINFGESDQVSPNLSTVCNDMEKLHTEFCDFIKNSKIGIMHREGIKIVVFGPPNVGKSSLVNAISHKTPSIVDERAGTTRDILDVPLDIKGFACNLFDTAGLHRFSRDSIEIKGMEKCRLALNLADMTIFVIDFAMYCIWKHDNRNYKRSVVEFIIEVVSEVGMGISINVDAKTVRELFSVETIVVFNKIDIPQIINDYMEDLSPEILCVSAAYDIRMCTLMHEIGDRLQKLTTTASDTPKVAHIRHCMHLTAAKRALGRFIIRYQGGSKDMALLVAELQVACRELTNIDGHVNPDDAVLDQIFNSFCVGK